ncbi:NADAR family protein [Streptomyces sp. NPDC048629]|uniref:NADAR family protein n=1 Tax=Streptomyces sp. NPDC048629 TaxID=3154824 RepID=UPI003421D26F
MSNQKIFRVVDGERIPGVSRPVFRRNGDTNYLVQLGIYADGMIDCWGLLTLEEFAAAVRSGRIVTRFEEGTRASVHETAEWEFARVRSVLTAESLIAEVRDDIDDLNGRPDSTARAWHAVHAFRAEPTEERRAELRAAYEEIPEHERHAALADHSVGDGPLYDLAMGIGAKVTPDEYQEALDYFDEEWGDPREFLARWRRPAEPEDPTVLLDMWHLQAHWPDDAPALAGLCNEWPAPLLVGDVTYPSVSAAWAAIAPPAEAHTAVMAALLRAKFDQHPDLADLLTGTGSARIHHRGAFAGPEGDFWGCEAEGRNWLGRLLELIRAELHVRRLELPL